MKYNLITTVLLSSALFACSATTPNTTSSMKLIEQGRYHSNIFDQSAAEIVSYDKLTQQTFVVNAQSGKIDVIDSKDIQHPLLAGSLNIKADLYKHLNVKAGAANSVDVNNGLVAIAIEAENKTDAGWVVFDTMNCQGR